MKTTSKWQHHFEAWQRSGLSQVGYCRQEQLNPKTFSARLSDYRKVGADKGIALIPVQVEGSVPAAVVVQLIQGHRLELSGAVPAGWVAELLKCLG